MTFQKGDEVRVVKQGLWSTWKSGIVINVNSRTIDAEVDGRILTYKPGSLTLIHKNNTKTEKGENNMLLGTYRVCKIKFLEGSNINREYYYALYDNDVCCGDNVVVKSANHGLGIAVIVDIIPDEEVTQSMIDYCNEGREIVAKFDMSVYYDRMAKRKAAKELKARMDQKVKEVQDLALYEMMAEKSPDLKEMLESYKELIK